MQAENGGPLTHDVVVFPVEFLPEEGFVLSLLVQCHEHHHGHQGSQCRVQLEDAREHGWREGHSRHYTQTGIAPVGSGWIGSAECAQCSCLCSVARRVVDCATASE